MLGRWFSFHNLQSVSFAGFIWISQPFFRSERRKCGWWLVIFDFPWISHLDVKQVQAKLVRFAHNWKNGIVEFWNVGFKENEIQNTFLHWFSYFSGVFYGVKVEIGCLTGIIIKCRYNIFCRIDLFLLFRPILPTFHYSIIPCGLSG